MKKLIAFLLLMTVAIAPVAGIAGKKYYTLADIRGQAAEGWKQTYETKWRTVEVDAPILLPEVEKVPVAMVGYDLREPMLTAEESGWDSVRLQIGSLILSNDGKAVPRSVGGKKINKNPEQKGDWYGGFAPQNTYVPLSSITFGEICEMIRGELVRFGYDVDTFQIEKPTRLWSQHWYYYGKKKDALPGHIMLEANQVLYGLPVVAHALDAVRDHTNGDRRFDEWWETFTLHAGYDAYDEQLSHLFISAAKPIEVVADDVPLCPWKMVKATVEEEIGAGRIRKLYEIQLGYALYNEPGSYREANQRGKEPPYKELRFYIKPVWQVNCLYVNSATDKLRKLPDDVYDERNTLDYYQLLIDAQTGEWIEESNAKNRSEFKGVLSWDDVGRER